MAVVVLVALAIVAPTPGTTTDVETTVAGVVLTVAIRVVAGSNWATAGGERTVTAPIFSVGDVGARAAVTSSGVVTPMLVLAPRARRAALAPVAAGHVVVVGVAALWARIALQLVPLVAGPPAVVDVHRALTSVV